MKKFTLILFLISLNAFSQKDIKQTVDYMERANDFQFQGMKIKDSIKKRENYEEALYYIEEAIKSEKLITNKQLTVMSFKSESARSLLKYPIPLLKRAEVKFYMGDNKGTIDDVNLVLKYVDSLPPLEIATRHYLYSYVDIRNRNDIIMERYNYKFVFKDFKGATDDLSLVIDTGDADGNIYYKRYFLRKRAGDIEGANKDLVSAVGSYWTSSDTKNQAEASFRLGKIYYESKAYEDALKLFKRAINYLAYIENTSFDAYGNVSNSVCSIWEYWFFRAKTEKELGMKEKKWCKSFSKAETFLSIASGNDCGDDDGNNYNKELSRIVVGCK